MRGYFGVGVDGMSKPMNLGNLLRIAHAFDASFFFTINARVKLVRRAIRHVADATGALPVYSLSPTPASSACRMGCRLVGVEITDDAIELPRFRHPHARGLCVRRRAHVAFAAGAVALRIRGENPDASFRSMSAWRAPSCCMTG